MQRFHLGLLVLSATSRHGWSARRGIRPPAEIAPDLGRPLAWCKTTISSFRLSELASHYEDEGWTVTPLLIVRDVRDTWASLLTKPYGMNGFTAEDPPLRLRFRRFKEDWELFRAKGWPILRYESLCGGS